MIEINISITIILAWIIHLWVMPTPAPGRRGRDQERAGPGQAGTAPDRAAVRDQLRAADSSDHNNMGTDDIVVESVGPAEEWAELEVDNDHGEEEVNPSTGIGTEVILEDGLDSGMEREASEAEGSDTGGGERPRPSGHCGANKWTRVRARVACTPAHWTCDPRECLRCQNTLNRRIVRHQFHLLNKE